MDILWIAYSFVIGLVSEVHTQEVVTWDEAIRRCNTSSNKPLYLPGFSEEEFQETREYMNKHEISSLWLNLKHISVFVWNNGSIHDGTISQATGDCGIQRDAKIQAVDCNVSRPVICRVNGHINCSTNSMSWEMAYGYCRSIGGTMLMRVEEDVCKMSDHYSSGEWIGLKRKWILQSAAHHSHGYGPNPVNSTHVNYFCPGINESVTCALMATYMKSQYRPECRFTSCTEIHPYLCSESLNSTTIVQESNNRNKGRNKAGIFKTLAVAVPGGLLVMICLIVATVFIVRNVKCKRPLTNYSMRDVNAAFEIASSMEVSEEAWEEAPEMHATDRWLRQLNQDYNNKTPSDVVYAEIQIDKQL